MACRGRADEGGREIRRGLDIRRGKVGGFFHGSRRAIRGGCHLGDREVGSLDHCRRREEEGPGRLETAGPDRCFPVSHTDLPLTMARYVSCALYSDALKACASKGSANRTVDRKAAYLSPSP